MVNHAPDQARPQPQHFFTPPYPIPAVSFRLLDKEDSLSLNKNCYPETDWEQFRDHYSQLLRCQASGRCYILVAEYHQIKDDRVDQLPELESSGMRGAVIIGSGQLINRGEKAEISELVVHQDYRNRRIGTAVIQILTELARQNGTDVLEIGVEVENQAALRLYRRLGFGRERSLQLLLGQEAIILSKSLAPRKKDEL
jgi:ribosomal protein S18 acetylase RimI-like enzyme